MSESGQAAMQYAVERSTRVSQVSAILAMLGLAILISLPFWGQKLCNQLSSMVLQTNDFWVISPTQPM